MPPELAHIPPEALALIRRIAARQRPRHHGRLSPVGIGLAAVAAVALIMGSNVSTSPDAGGPAIEQEADWRLAQDGQVLELRELPAEGIAGIQPDEPTHEVPLGPSTIRIEVVSADPTAWIMVGSEVGDAQVWDAALPYAAELDLETRPDRFRVTVYSRYGNATTQCRVYADGALVAIDTDYGSADCAADAIR